MGILSASGNRNRNIVLAVYLLISVIVLLFSILFLIQAIQAYSFYQYERGFSLLLTGVVGLALSLYMLSVYMRRPGLIRRRELRRMVTVVECISCDYRSKREYSYGDYVLKEHGECPVCGKKVVVTEIYPEIVSKK